MNSETRFALGGSSAKPCSGGPSNEAFPSPPTFPQLRSQNLNFQLPDMGLLSWTALIFFFIIPRDGNFELRGTHHRSLPAGGLCRQLGRTELMLHSCALGSPFAHQIAQLHPTCHVSLRSQNPYLQV